MKKIQSTRALKPHDIIRIHKKGFGYAVIEVIETNDYYLAALGEPAVCNHIGVGDEVEVYLWIENDAAYEFSMRIIGAINEDACVLFFKHTDDITWSKERKCLSIDTSLPLRFFVLNKESNHKAFAASEIQFLHGEVIQLGDREAILRYQGDLGTDILIKGHLVFNSECEIDIAGRLQKLDADNRYLIQFSGISDKDRHKILDYIFSRHAD